MEVRVPEYNPLQWRLFTDSSKCAWRWFYSTTEKIPLRIFGSCSQHEGKLWKYLGKFKYDEFKWKLCGDLKIEALFFFFSIGLPAANAPDVLQPCVFLDYP
jgi:hypothetical protein